MIKKLAKVKSMDVNIELIEKRGNVFCDSLKVAEHFHKRHKNVLRDIENLGCSKEFNRLNFEPIKYVDLRNREQKKYLITKDGFSILVMGYTGAEAMKFKEAYIRQFNQMQKVLLEKKTPAWQAVRAAGKIARRMETDAIKEFVTYAMQRGSKNADKYYIHFTNLANKLAGVQSRDKVPAYRLNCISFAEILLENEIRKNLFLELPYKDIYVNCRQALGKIPHLELAI
jgi:Rha family phage regulatory protein